MNASNLVLSILISFLLFCRIALFPKLRTNKRLCTTGR